MDRMLASLALVFFSGIAMASPFQLINDETLGYYNDGIGTLLNETNPAVDDNGFNSYLFPAGLGNPVFESVSIEPNLSSAGHVLGDWLSHGTPDDHWSAPRAIPNSWESHTETAIVYAIDAGGFGLDNVTMSIGVDNGA